MKSVIINEWNSKRLPEVNSYQRNIILKNHASSRFILYITQEKETV